MAPLNQFSGQFGLVLKRNHIQRLLSTPFTQYQNKGNLNMGANPKNFKTPIALLQNQGGSKIRVFTIE